MSNGSDSQPDAATSFQRIIAARQSHTTASHQTTAEIRHNLNIGPVTNLLLWLSKTDIHVLGICTHHTRLTLSSLGMMVIFTSLLAFCSSFYALLTTLVSPDSVLRWPITTILATLYAFGIMIIDREIVGAVSKKALWIRFIFAICIATAISWPVKLQFFEGRIQTEINSMLKERNADKLDRIQELRMTGKPERAQERTDIQRRLDSLNKGTIVLDREINREANNVYCGPKCEGYRAQKAVLLADAQRAEARLQTLAIPITLPPKVQSEIQTLEPLAKLRGILRRITIHDKRYCCLALHWRNSSRNSSFLA